MKLLCLSGNFTRPSKTRTLIEAVGAEASRLNGADVQVFDLLDAGPSLGTCTSRQTASNEHLRIWNAVRECDALVVGSPVYKASYTGLLKHFFDLLEADIMTGKPVMLVATGKAAHHMLMIDHQLRPLFAFFKALSLPAPLFALDADFSTTGQPTDALLEQVRVATADLNRYKQTHQSTH